MVSWAEAVNNAIPPDAQRRYDHAVSQVRELNELVQDFANIVERHGKWPMTTRSEYDNTLVPRTLNTRITSQRHVWLNIDRSWGVSDYLQGTKNHPDFIFAHRRDGSVEIGFLCKSMLDTISHPRFDEICTTVGSSLEWAPRELVNYLQSNDLPVPGVP